MKQAKEREAPPQLAAQTSGEFAIGRPSERVFRRRVEHMTYSDRAESELFRLCVAIGHESEFERNLEAHRMLMGGWGEAAIPKKTPYPSAIGDDHSPYEFSLAFEPGAVELRLLVEAQAERPSPSGNRAAALELNEYLMARYDLDEWRFNKTRDLFLDGDPVGPFTLWHAVCWNPGEFPAFKLYMNPLVRGADAALPLVSEALSRLGFGERPQALLRQLVRSPKDEIRYFSLDMSPGPASRVKVYVAHHGATVDDLEDRMALSPHHIPGDVRDFCHAMVDGETRFFKKPVTTCASFVEGSTVPHAMTMHLPIAHYAEHDGITARRVGSYLRERDLDDVAYRRAVHVLATRPLEEGVGLQSYASYRRERDGLRFTAYLSPQLFTE